MVTCFAWIAHKFISSNKQIRYASVTSCRPILCCLEFGWQSWSLWRISCTTLRKGNLGIKSSVDFWNLLISCKAWVPGQNLLLLAILDTSLDLIWSNHFTPILGMGFCLSLSFWHVLDWQWNMLVTHPSWPTSILWLLFWPFFCDEKYLSKSLWPY